VKTIALIAQKGGVGKTTLAINLAIASGMRAAIFDLDQQESATIWADRRKSDMPHVEFLTERRLAEGLKAAERGNFELAIIDTPPAAGPQAFSAAQSADLILIPCRPSLVDLDAIKRTAQLIKSARMAATVASIFSFGLGEGRAEPKSICSTSSRNLAIRPTFGWFSS
jgi:chromosome partitioning protein